LHLAIIAMFTRIWNTSTWWNDFMYNIFPL